MATPSADGLPSWDNFSDVSIPSLVSWFSRFLLVSGGSRTDDHQKH